jgi:hypothetical protein
MMCTCEHCGLFDVRGCKLGEMPRPDMTWHKADLFGALWQAHVRDCVPDCPLLGGGGDTLAGVGG